MEDRELALGCRGCTKRRTFFGYFVRRGMHGNPFRTAKSCKPGVNDVCTLSPDATSQMFTPAVYRLQVVACSSHSLVGCQGVTSLP